MSGSWRTRYDAHIRSAKWANMRRDMIRLRGNKCERCGAQTKLVLHHKTYERLGKELTTDFEILCGRCHTIADRERAREGEARSATAFYYAGLETYASKKYGEEWEACYDAGQIEEEFDAWLERKAEWD